MFRDGLPENFSGNWRGVTFLVLRKAYCSSCIESVNRSVGKHDAPTAIICGTWVAFSMHLSVLDTLEWASKGSRNIYIPWPPRPEEFLGSREIHGVFGKNRVHWKSQCFHWLLRLSKFCKVFDQKFGAVLECFVVCQKAPSVETHANPWKIPGKFHGSARVFHGFSTGSARVRNTQGIYSCLLFKYAGYFPNTQCIPFIFMVLHGSFQGFIPLC